VAGPASHLQKCERKLWVGRLPTQAETDFGNSQLVVPGSRPGGPTEERSLDV